MNETLYSSVCILFITALVPQHLVAKNICYTIAEDKESENGLELGVSNLVFEVVAKLLPRTAVLGMLEDLVPSLLCWQISIPFWLLG